MARPQSGLDRRIVEKARARFLIEGVDGASLRQIAKDAETNIGMVYYYFPTKDDLFLAVVEDIYLGLLGAMTTVLEGDATPEERILRIYQRVASMSEVEFDVLRLIIREALISSSRLSKLAARFREGHLPAVFSVVLEGMATGAFRQDLPPLGIMAPMMAIGMFPQLMRRLVLAAELPIVPIVPGAEETALILHDVLLHGVRGTRAAAAQARTPSTSRAPQAEVDTSPRSTSPRAKTPRKSQNATPGTTAIARKTKKSR